MTKQLVHAASPSSTPLIITSWPHPWPHVPRSSPSTLLPPSVAHLNCLLRRIMMAPAERPRATPLPPRPATDAAPTTTPSPTVH
ncbi:hypothetical protein RvY_18977 [Ramazzottius varieornatus]|uniref:Uncharacterized protein n=1 Tax=Ramazzottius varieornatus TaxID=947166 RepID=A0A1D1W7Q8_RAMVA|nr:hypothetical protein RvY_18977 [Ramazzottius varieornatus]